MEKQEIKKLALACGFKLKQQESGDYDLNPYVYDFAAAIVRHVKGDPQPLTKEQGA